MIIYGNNINLNEKNVNEFFSQRAKIFDKTNPYVSVLGRDDDPDVSEKCNKIEAELVVPQLSLNRNLRILDVGCGIGRWADNLKNNFGSYLGIDSVQEFVDIAKARFEHNRNVQFAAVSAQEFYQYCAAQKLPKFNRVIASEVVQYINDEDLIQLLKILDEITEDGAFLYFLADTSEEGERITLVNVYSEEIKSSYNVICRTQKEYESLFKMHLDEKFQIISSNDIFKYENITQSEIAQHYWILKKTT